MPEVAEELWKFPESSIDSMVEQRPELQPQNVSDGRVEELQQYRRQA